jgi:hypothetical protein
MKTLILQCTLFLSILFCLLLLTYGQAQAAEFEFFECKPLNDSWNNIIATLGIHDNETNGTVSLAGHYHLAKYSVDGFERRWSYGEMKENGMYPYSILMKLDGETGFFDFRKSKSGNAYPIMIAQCRKTK